jgi:Asp-tRNA(Asn)/Glu-tRNA(Gln) amidotransferase A subunit family amidase
VVLLSSSYQSFHGGAGPSLEVAVPSRLYYPKLPSKPLNGMRVSIKDNINLSGIKTSLSSRAWNTLYPEVADTAPAVQYLIDLGAVIVGKTILSQFAEVENPTGDWVDYHCPFNPRGDGYLTPDGSSSGAGASLAAYDWLDISMATDSESKSSSR